MTMNSRGQFSIESFENFCCLLLGGGWQRAPLLYCLAHCVGCIVSGLIWQQNIRNSEILAGVLHHQSVALATWEKRTCDGHIMLFNIKQNTLICMIFNLLNSELFMISLFFFVSIHVFIFLFIYFELSDRTIYILISKSNYGQGLKFPKTSFKNSSQSEKVTLRFILTQTKKEGFTFLADTTTAGTSQGNRHQRRLFQRCRTVHNV